MYSAVLLAALAAGGANASLARGHGYFGSWSCEGCFGCWGNHSGPTCHGAEGYGGFGHHACMGCSPVQVGGTATTPATTKPAASPDTKPGTTPPKEMKPATDPGTSEKGKTTAGGNPRPARLLVDLPEGARLYVDGQLLPAKSGPRTFRTPELREGQLYYYLLRVEVARDGRTVERTKQVVLRAGEDVRASFMDMGAPLTAQLEMPGR